MTLKKKNQQKPAFPREGIARPVVILIIAVIAIAGLSLFLLFSRQLVGRAYFAAEENTAGIVDPGIVSANQAFSLKVQAKIPSQEKTVAIEFELPLPAGLSCQAVTSLLGWTSETEVLKETSCVNNKVTFKRATLDAVQAKSGTFDVAQVSLQRAPAGSYDLSFTYFNLISLATQQDLIDNGLQATLQIQAPVEGLPPEPGAPSAAPTGEALPEAAVCGNGKIEAGETCDDGNTVNGDGCSATCQYQCTDSDGGLNIFERGTITRWGVQPETELCYLNTHINEVYCLNDVNIKMDQIECSNGCQNGACVAVQPPSQCTGTPPSYAQLCSGDNTGLSQNTAVKPVSQCGTAKCEYQCSSGYAPNVQGTNCEALVTVQGTKVTLTDIPTANNVFSTKVTATETFTQEITIYTLLYDVNGKVLALKLEKVAGLTKDQTYTAALNYPETNVKKKSVILYDVKQNPAVFGSLNVEKP